MRARLALLLALTTASASAQEPVLSRGWTFDEQGGASFFANVCAACHQGDGGGAVGAASYPKLAGDPALASTDFVVSVVLGGLHAMPSFAGAMSDAQAAAVVNYVRERFAAATDDPATAARVAEARASLRK